MDTSETYIKMCDNQYVQENIAYFISDPRKGIEYQGDNVIVALDVFSTTWRCIRLLRQSQIQKMCLRLDWVKVGFLQVLNAFYDFVFDEVYEETVNQQQIKNHPYKSMEQLWLAFYMHEKHKKKWGGEKWVK